MLDVQGFSDQRVDFLDDARVVHAVGENGLSKADEIDIRLGRAEEHDAGHLGDKLVASGHGGDQRVEAEIGRQRVGAGQKRPGKIDVSIGKQQVHFHRMRSLRLR